MCILYYHAAATNDIIILGPHTRPPLQLKRRARGGARLFVRCLYQSYYILR